MADIPDITLTVNRPEELPDNLFKFYDGLTRKERVVSMHTFCDGIVQAVTEDEDTGLFKKELIPEGGKMYLSYEKHSPLFVEFPGKLVVIAPCESKRKEI